MTQAAGRWPRAERLDADRVVDEINAQTGIGLVVEGPCPGGEVGASYVRWPDGRRCVLTWQPDRSLADLEGGQFPAVEALRRIGYPAPATELSVQLDRAVVLVQELLPGQRIGHVSTGLLDQALMLNERQRGVLAGRPDMRPVRLFLTDDGPGFCLHEPLRQHSRRSAALEAWIRGVGADHSDRLPGDDAVHVDFHPGNMLAVDDSITGVVDWDGAGRGDRRLDLVTLRFGVHPARSDPGVVDRLDDILGAMPAEVLRPAWAHMSLRQVDWAIRHFPPNAVADWLTLAEQRAT